VSGTGNVTIVRTPRIIHGIAQKARDELYLGPSGRIAHDPEWLLEKLVRPIKKVELDVCSDADLPSSHACFDVADRILRIRESVLRRARDEDPDALFTVWHELGHIYLHSDPLYFRETPPKHLPIKFRDPEWQADFFAVDFSVDRSKLAIYDTPLKAASYFRVPLIQMQKYFDQLTRDGILTPNPRSALEHYLDRAVQGELDI